MENLMMRPLLCVCTALAALPLAGLTLAADPAAGGPTVETLASGLKNPCGVAVQPDTGNVFVAVADAVMRYDAKAQWKASPAITGFKTDIYGKGPMYDIGPLGLLFLDRDTLVVGGGDLPDGQELMRVYSLASGKPQKVDDATMKLGPISPGEESKMGEGNFYGLAHDSNGIYITSNGDDTKGWVLRMPLKNGRPTGKLETFIATKIATDVDAPVGITMSKEGHIIIGQMGEINVPHDSLLTAYDPATGKLLWKADTGLYDITALAYSPKTGKLYALDYAWMKPEDGGLFELTVLKASTGKVSVKATKVAPLGMPTAMAFAPDGTLFITIIGAAQESDKPPQGKLLRIASGL